MLGVCYGAQLLAYALRGASEPSPIPEFGWVEVHSGEPTLAGRWFQWHQDRAIPPIGATVSAATSGNVQAWQYRSGFAIQFHPEVTDDILRRWCATGADELKSQGVDPDSFFADQPADHDVARVATLLHTCCQLRKGIGMSHVNRIALVTEPDDPEVKETLEALKRAYGRVPNFYAVLAQSPAALRAMTAFDDAIDGGRLDAKLAERIALLSAQANRCEYCLAAHSAAGRAAGLPADEIASARIGQSSDRRSAIALRVAQEMLDRAGDVSDETLVAAREEGFGDAELVELLALLASNIFSNYLSRLARTEIDYKRVGLDDDIVPANGSSS